MVLQIALVLLIFFFFFLTYMVSKRWRIFHVVCLVAVFFAAIAAMFYSAFTLRTQEVWRTIANDQTRRLEQETAEINELQYGNFSDIAQQTASVQSARAELERTVIDRGRVWRDCVPQNVNYDQATGLLTLDLQIPPRQAAQAPPPDANGGDPAAPPPAAGGAPGVRHLMEEKIILFAFLELASDPNDPNSLKVPAYYLGEYFAVSVTPSSVTLRSVVPPGPVEIQAAQSLASTWVLYEVMPADAHIYFADMDEQTIRGLLSPERTGLTQARAQLDQGAITQEQYDRIEQQYQQTIEAYVRDHQDVKETDPPERRWVEVNFLRDYDVEVDAEKPTVLTSQEQNFDSQGRAKSVQLQQGSPTSFDIGSTVLMDYATASDLRQQGVVEWVKEVYVRELRDYEYSFHNIYRRIVELEQNIRNTDRDIVKANEAIGKMRDQIAFREEEKTKLTEDLGHLTQERDKLVAYLTELDRFRADLAGQMSSLYQHTNALELQLGEIQAGMAEEIENRANRAVAEVGAGAQ